MKPIVKVFIGLYILIGILTFGAAAARVSDNCHLIDPDQERVTCQTDAKTSGALIAGVFWPLWWSWEAFS